LRRTPAITPAHPRPIFGLLAVVAASGLLLAACGDDSEDGSAGDDSGATAAAAGDCETDVCMEGIAYTESEVTVSAGDAVTWTNLDRVDHTVTAGTPEAPAPEEFDSGEIDGGETFALPFDTAGEFVYYCTIHPQMQASVLVE
jgi:plastocyanin